jgi:epoxyqueuosine reductase
MGQDGYKSSLSDLIDDATYKRFDQRTNYNFITQYVSKEKLADMEEKFRQKRIEGMRENKPGLQLRDRAFLNASFFEKDENLAQTGRFMDANLANVGYRSWTVAGNFVRTPQDLGVPRYDGDPKEAAKIVKHAAKSFGASRTGITGLDRRHIYRYTREGKEIVFEPVEEPYETGEKLVIPEKCKYVVVMLLQMPPKDYELTPFPVGAHVPIFTYVRIDLLVCAVADFIRGLGYTALPCANDTGPSIPLAIEAGLGELGRADKLVNPDFGPLVRICKVFTDLPMELDKPKDSGIARFCRDCQRCAEACPVKAINTQRDPSFKVAGPWNNPGHKAWSFNSLRCSTSASTIDVICALCLNACPWNKPNGWLHRLVKAIIKRTSLFNKFFVAADKFFGYGKVPPSNPEKWWDLDLPTYGIDTHR